MSAEQMDPAPAPKPGSTDASKVWLGGGKIGDPTGVVAGLVDDDDDDANMAPAAIDEANMFTSVSKAYVPACFFEREAYQQLHAEGLTDLPESGLFRLSYHSVSKQWHAMWEAESKNFAPTWGSLRSELKALLLVLIRIWEWQLSASPEDVAAQECLNKIRAYSESVSFWRVG